MIILLSMHETDQHQDLFIELLVLDLVRQELDVLSEKKENL